MTNFWFSIVTMEGLLKHGFLGLPQSFYFNRSGKGLENLHF